MDLDMEVPILACNTYYTQNGNWGTRRRLGDLLQIGLFNLYLDSFFVEFKQGNLKFPL